MCLLTLPRQLVKRIPASLDFGQAIAAKLVNERASHFKGDDIFYDDAGRRQRANVAPLIGSLLRRLGLHVDRSQWFGECADRFLGCSYDQWLAVCHTGFQSAGIVRRSHVSERWAIFVCFVVVNRIVNLRTWQASRFEAEADLDALDRLNCHDRLRDPSIQFLVPLSVRTEPKRQSFDPDFYDSAECITLLARLVNQLAKLLIEFRPERIDDTFVASLAMIFDRVASSVPLRLHPARSRSPALQY